jgi:hypothetical protein
MPCSFAFAWTRSVCSFGTSTASFSRSSASVGKTGAAWPNSGNTTSRTGRNGAAPASALSIIDSIRSVLAFIPARSIGFGWSVWHAAAEYRITALSRTARSA